MSGQPRTLCDDVIDVLRTSSQPLKTPEIIARLRQDFGRDEISKSEVNAFLYGLPSWITAQDSDHRWHLVTNSPPENNMPTEADSTPILDSPSCREPMKLRPAREDPNEEALMMRLGQVGKVLDVFLKVDQGMSLSNVRLFLEVARKPGISLTDLSEQVGLALSTTSISVGILGRYGRGGRAGLELMATVENPTNRRAKVVELTAKGEKLLASMLKELCATRQGE